ncbi:Trans-aconitate 2-methyltransferase 3 [Colletotrichum chlorophyti]|uniref:Trans-aconitate 2-methyltransferase 3 n=1 Tax=Colletotrichum chlorophyti TaxID=708187 RepID=A0A1Q8RVW2_9PEZI|nr:Trans-aconitate 2-methyltransferase 3 [Colletotrichum chlorophyti]
MAEVDHEVNIAADDLTLLSSSTSVSSSILDYRFENGRTYHRYKDGKYVIPNDERENDRLDLQHHICLLTLGGRLGLAPPCQPGAEVGRTLDVGTGTGIWAIQFADDHPEAEVSRHSEDLTRRTLLPPSPLDSRTVFNGFSPSIGLQVLGIDLSPIQPDFVAPNVKFEIDDVEEEWIFNQPFDYIHCRFMMSSIANWKEFFSNCFHNLSPGGHLEVQEGEMLFQSDDATFPEDSALARFGDLLTQAAIKFGREFVPIATLKKLMIEVGFEDVTLSRHKWPINDWPKDPKFKELGAWCYENNVSGIEAISMAPLTRAHNWTREEVNVFLADVRNDLKNRNYHAYFPVLRESMLEYRVENGRTYHRYQGRQYVHPLPLYQEYNLPNDERELERLDLTHQLWLLVNDNRLGIAPPCQEGAKVARVLDVGTGTGIWAMDFGDEHPEAEVIGIDLSPTLPAYVPPNVRFEVDDAEEEWTYSKPFDYIHCRVLTSSLSDWKLYLRRCFENLEPGGWLELQEIDLFAKSDDGTLTPESSLLNWCQLLLEASERFGRP